MNPLFSELPESDMNVVVAASNEAIAMVEGETFEVSEDDMIAALEFGHNEIKKIVSLIDEIASEIGNEKRVVEPVEVDENLKAKVFEMAKKSIPES